MMPRPDNRLIFDPRPAAARLDTESTMHQRELWPDLAWVWDELDELRQMRDEPDDALDAVDALRGELSDTVDVLNEIIADDDISEALTKRLDALVEDIEYALKKSDTLTSG